jgi:hypothetical protein
MTERNQQKDWRELSTAVAKETDPGKFDFLVEQLIQALDDGQQDWRARTDQPHEAIQRLVAMPTGDVDRQVARDIQLRLDRLRCALMRASRTSGTRISEYIAELSRRLALTRRRSVSSRRSHQAEQLRRDRGGNSAPPRSITRTSGLGMKLASRRKS